MTRTVQTLRVRLEWGAHCAGVDRPISRLATTVFAGQRLPAASGSRLDDGIGLACGEAADIANAAELTMSLHNS